MPSLHPTSDECALPTAPGATAFPPAAITRRRLAQAAAWSVPAISLASAAPAFARSTVPTGTFTVANAVTNPGNLEVSRCGSYQVGRVSFTVSSSNPLSNTAPYDVLRIVLPLGLDWVGAPDTSKGEDGRTRVVSPPTTPLTNGTATAVVALPAFRVSGTAGAYSLAATFHDKTVHQTFQVSVTEGTFRQIVRQAGGPTVAATFTVNALSIPGARTAEVTGDQTAASAGSNLAVLLSTGQARIQGADLVATNPLAYNGTALTSLTRISSWTSTAWASADSTNGVLGATSVGGAVARATSGTAASGTTTSANTGVWAWFRDRSATGNGTTQTTRQALRVAAVTGLPSGKTVLGLWSHAGMGYVHLQDSGVYMFNAFLANTNATGSVAATLMANTATSTLASTWGHHRRTQANTSVVITYGGAALIGRTLRVWSGTQTPSTTASNGTVPATATTTTTTTAVALPTAMGTPVKLTATDSGLVVLDHTGGLWTYGTRVNGANAWSPSARAVGVVDYHAWGYDTDYRYVGGAYIDISGNVTQFLDHTTFQTASVVEGTSNTPITGIRRLETADGTYLALRYDGTLYGWNGNLDNSGITKASVLSNVLTELQGATSVDIGVWGFHYTTGPSGTRRYTGGGHVLTSVACSF